MADLLVTDYGAVCDGTTDDSSSIQAALSVAVPGDRVYFPAGVTSKARFLTIKSGTTVDLGTATLVVGSNAPPRIWMLQTEVGASGIAIRGGRVIGSRQPVTGLQWGIGLRIDQASMVSVRDTSFEDWFFDGVWVGGNLPSLDVSLVGVRCTNNRRNGLSLVNATRVWLTGCRFQGTSGQDPQSGVDVEPNPGERVTDLRIYDCTFESNASVGLYMHKGRGAPGSNYKVVSCSFYSNTRYGLVGNAVDNLSVLDCNFSGGSAVSPLGVSASLGDNASRVTFGENLVMSPRGLLLAGVRGIKAVDNENLRPEIISVPGGGVSGDVVMLGNS